MVPGAKGIKDPRGSRVVAEEDVRSGGGEGGGLELSAPAASRRLLLDPHSRPWRAGPTTTLHASQLWRPRYSYIWQLA